MQGEGKGGTAWIEKQCISLKSEGTNACISVTVTDFICPICKHPGSDFEKIVKKTEVKEMAANK